MGKRSPFTRLGRKIKMSSNRTRIFTLIMIVTAGIVAIMYCNQPRQDRIGNGIISGFSIDPRGEQIAVGTTEGVFYYSIDTLEQVFFNETQSFVTDVAFSPNGFVLAVGLHDGMIILYETQSKEITGEFQAVPGLIREITFSPDGRLLAAIAKENTVHVWEIESGIERQVYGDTVNCLAFSPNGKTIAMGLRDGSITLNDPHSLEILQVLEGHERNVSSILFSSDNARLVSVAPDALLNIWDIETGEKLHTLSRDVKVAMYSVTYTMDGEKIAVGSGDGTVTLWDANSGRLIKTIEGHKGIVRMISFTPNGKTLVSGALEDTINLWDPETGDKQNSIDGYIGSVGSLALADNHALLASGLNAGPVTIWNTKTGEKLHDLVGHEAAVVTVAFSPDGKMLASGSHDGTIIVWDAVTGARNSSFDDLYDQEFIRFVEFTSDNEIVSVTVSGRTFLFNPNNGEVKYGLHDGEALGMVLALSPGGDRLVTGQDENVVIWDAHSIDKLLTLEGHSRSVFCADISQFNNLLASGSTDGQVILWDSISGERILTLNGHSSQVTSIAFSLDGTQLASGSAEGEIHLWDVNSGTIIRTMNKHNGAVGSIAFSPDGKLLASGSWDGTINLELIP